MAHGLLEKKPQATRRKAMSPAIRARTIIIATFRFLILQNGVSNDKIRSRLADKISSAIQRRDSRRVLQYTTIIIIIITTP